MNDREFGKAEGERLKSEALTLLHARRGRIVRQGQRALLRILLAGALSATADDVRGEVELPEGIDPRCLGSIPGPLARAGIIQSLGYGKSCRPSAHARPLLIWQLADRQAAERWLVDNPDIPDDYGDLPLFRHVH